MKKVEHLKLIQEVIGRLSGYSYKIKSWTVSLITFTITLGFSLNEGGQLKIALALSLAISILFLFLDLYYYILEKSYRNLFEKVRILDEKDIDFKMSFGKFDFIANDKYQKVKVCPLIGFISPSILLLYLPIISVLIILMFVL